MNDQVKTENKPPYVAYKTFQNFIGNLRSTGIPGRIDRSVLVGYSGATQSFLLTSLRFLQFVDDKGSPSTEFVRLVNEPNNEGPILAKAAKASYHFIFDGSLNVETATEGQLLDKFREFDLGGDTIRKCLSFFVLLCNAADIKLSPHVKGVRAESGNGSASQRRPYRRRRTSGENLAGITPPAAPRTAQKSVQEMLLEKFPQFDPAWSPDVQVKWFENFEKFMRSAVPAEATK